MLQTGTTTLEGVKPTVDVFPDATALSRGVAELFAEQARKAVRARGRFLVLLSGGQTPFPTYRLLAQEPLRSVIPWHDVQLFWGDERWVPPDDRRSNYLMARRAFLDELELDDSRVHPVPYLESPHESALCYERTLRAFFKAGHPRFDLVLLGMGEDGHTASLFPGSPVLFESSRWVCEVYLAEQDLYRVTTTPLLINQAALVAFVVAGKRKAGVLKRVLEGPHAPERTPAQLIQPEQGTLLWLTDRDAAQLLEQKTLGADQT